jgi:hypothetical protein
VGGSQDETKVSFESMYTVSIGNSMLVSPVGCEKSCEDFEEHEGDLYNDSNTIYSL